MHSSTRNAYQEKGPRRELITGVVGLYHQCNGSCLISMALGFQDSTNILRTHGSAKVRSRSQQNVAETSSQRTTMKVSASCPRTVFRGFHFLLVSFEPRHDCWRYPRAPANPQTKRHDLVMRYPLPLKLDYHTRNQQHIPLDSVALFGRSKRDSITRWQCCNR